MERLRSIIKMSEKSDGLVKFNKNGAMIIYNVNERTIERLTKIITGENTQNEEGSDKELLEVMFNNISDINSYFPQKYRFVEEDEVLRRKNPYGGFCKYYHKLPINLQRYGVFKEGDDMVKYHRSNCLYHSLEELGLSKSKLEKLKTVCMTRDFSKKNIKIVAEELKIYIIVRGGVRPVCFGNEEDDQFEIAYYDDHYFPYEIVPFSRYFLKNYKSLKKEKNPEKISGVCIKGYYKREATKLSSLSMMKLVHELHSKPIPKTDLFNTNYYTKVKNRVTCLEYETGSKLYLRKEEKDPKRVLRIFFDFETVSVKINEKEKILRPRELCAMYDEHGKSKKLYYRGYSCGRDFMDKVMRIVGYQEIHLIAHNAKFDLNFIIQYFNNVEICKNDGVFIMASSRHGSTRIVVKDSMKFMNCGLADFAGMFKLNAGKGDFDHSKIREEDFNEDGYLMDEALSEESRIYCERDVEVLKKGYNTFAGWVSDLGINIDDIYTSASLAKVYAERQGCFDGTSELSGIPQTYINQAMYGGRVMTRLNEHVEKDDCKVATLDANSLYPSAMISMPGFLKGEPKVIKELNMDFLNRQDYYYIDIKITKIGKRYTMPMLCIKGESSISYNDDINNYLDQEITVGKVYLEDLIRFHEIEFEIVRGYYFNEGFNTKIVEVVNYLFDKRNELKKQGNPAQEIYKLIMNSIYGRCLLKPKTKRLIVKKGEPEMVRYLIRNKNNIEMVEKIYDSELFCIREYREINNDFNSVHIGCQVLDYSKRIMNKVINVAETNDIDVYYTDTDSIHLDLENIEKLRKIYMEIYDYDIIHNNLLGFKPDLNKKEFGYAGENIYATNVVYNGKKTYCMQINGGYDYVRAKGIPSRALKYTADEKYNGSMIDMYKDLKNNPVSFDLTCGGTAFTPIQKFNLSICDQNEFTRILNPRVK